MSLTLSKIFTFDVVYGTCEAFYKKLEKLLKLKILRHSVLGIRMGKSGPLESAR